MEQEEDLGLIDFEKKIVEQEKKQVERLELAVVVLETDYFVEPVEVVVAVGFVVVFVLEVEGFEAQA